MINITSLNRGYARAEKLTHEYQRLTDRLKDRLSGLRSTTNLRKVQPEDDLEVQEFIRQILHRKGGIGVAELLYDDELSQLSSIYHKEGAFFSVLTYKKKIVGTIGIRRDKDAEHGCKIKKFYVMQEFNTPFYLGRMLEQILEKAQSLKYKSCSMLLEPRETELTNFFERYGFRQVDSGFHSISLRKFQLEL